MKKLIILLSLLIGFACEDDKEDDAALNFDGTYKLSSKTWSIDCDGDENYENSLDEISFEATVVEKEAPDTEPTPDPGDEIIGSIEGEE